MPGQKRKKALHEVVAIHREGEWWELAAENGKAYFVSNEGIRSDRFETDNEVVIPFGEDLVRKARPIFFLASEPEDFISIEILSKDLLEFIMKYCDLSDVFAKMAAYYILISWVYEDFRTLPYLRVLGLPGSGKSRFLDIMARLCFRAIYLGAGSESAFFRLVDTVGGTLVFDEADVVNFDEYQAILKILLTGYHDSGTVARVEEGKATRFRPILFSTYGPKVLASRERFNEALESRCLTETMYTTSRNDIPIELPEEIDNEALHFRNRLLDFRFKEFGIHKVNIQRTLDVEPRLNQILNPMLALSANNGWSQDVISFAQQMQIELLEERGTRWEALVARAVVTLVDTGKRLGMGDIAKFINENLSPDEEFTPQRVGYCVKHLALPKRTVSGRKEVRISPRLVETLRARYILQDTPTSTQSTFTDQIDQVQAIRAAFESLPERTVHIDDIARETGVPQTRLLPWLERLRNEGKVVMASPGWYRWIS